MASQARSTSSAAAAGVRAPAGWCQNRRSSAAWTSVPFTAGGDGGSGSRSIWEKRNASGQLVNELTLEGLRVRGGLSAIASDYGGAATAPVHSAAGPGRGVRPERVERGR